MTLKLSELISEINEIFNYDNFSNKSFEKFTLIIRDRKNIDIFYLFFKEIYKDIEFKNIKCFLSIYTFIYYPEIMNLEKDFKINKEIIKISKIIEILFKGLLKKIIENNYDLKNDNIKHIITFFIKKFKEYLVIFNEWCQLDREAIFFNLAVCIYQMDEDLKKIIEKNDKDSKDDEEYNKKSELLKITKDNIEKEKDKMFKRALMVDKNKGRLKVINYFNYINYEKKNESRLGSEKFLEILELQIEKNIKRAYWDLFEDDFNKEPPKTDNLIMKLNELNDLIIKCVPNRIDIHIEIKTHLDPSFIKHKVKCKLFDNYELIKYINFILNKLKNFQSKEDDIDTIMFEKYILGLIEKNEKIGKILRIFFKFVFEKFEKIFIDKNNFLEEIIEI